MFESVVMLGLWIIVFCLICIGFAVESIQKSMNVSENRESDTDQELNKE